MRKVIISYDVSSKCRAARLRKVMVKHALPVQKSVFLFSGTEEAFERLLTEALKCINQKRDDLRCYAVPARGFRRTYGRSLSGEGVLWSEAGFK